jgi:hypothetical protein
VTIYPDTDGDHFGAGTGQGACTDGTAPAGFSLRGDDCAPDDGGRWQLLPYQFRDFDGDTYTVAEASTLCSGDSLPKGYLTSAKGNDCNDRDPKVWASIIAYPDTDNDHVGAGPGNSFCTDGTAPPGMSLLDSDCAPDDGNRWQLLPYQFRDGDGDTYTVANAGSICSGNTLPTGYLTAAKGNDCDDGNPDLWAWTILYPDHDGDHVGAPPRQIQCLGKTIPDGMSIYGDDDNDNDPNVQIDEEGDEAFRIVLQ